jgi:hypothetical protein
MKTAAAFIVAVLVAGCATKGTSPVAGGTCDASKAAGFVSRKADAALIEEAKQATGAVQARVLAPDTIVTMEYSAGRLNLEVDAAGIVQKVRCG